MSKFYQPLGGKEMARFGGPATMTRLPMPDTPAGLNTDFIGILMTIDTSNRSGTHFGLRQIRGESRMLRPFDTATDAVPFDHPQVADTVDAPINTLDRKKPVDSVTDC